MPAAAAPADGAAALPPQYRISVGDALALDFLDDDAPAFPVAVGDTGAVQAPFLGAVEVAGLTLEAARDAIARRYVEAQILLAPQIDLSVVTLRPFSVLGDVQTPGFYDYRAGITVEQAVGLAGGPVRAAGGEEARSLQRAALRGEVEAADASLLREAVAAARSRTQLAGGTAIDPASLAVAAGVRRDPAQVAALIAQEDRMIEAEARLLHVRARADRPGAG